jgi:hypothetical protein
MPTQHIIIRIRHLERLNPEAAKSGKGKVGIALPNVFYASIGLLD